MGKADFRQPPSARFTSAVYLALMLAVDWDVERRLEVSSGRHGALPHLGI